MLVDLLEASDTAAADTPFDVVIVGAGAAGITVARRLEAAGKTVALVEGGGLDYSDESQELYAGEVVGDPYFDLEYARLRYFGGTTNHWTGWCRSFEPVDFDRGYLGAEYEWPIALSEIEKYKSEACDILEVPNRFDDRAVGQSDIKQIEFQFSPPVLFRDKYFDDLAASENVTVFLNATLVDVSGDQGRVSAGIFESFNGNRVSIPGASFVFAMGGIENSRYLLWIEEKHRDRFFASGLPIGKYWMEHPHFTLGQAIVETDKVPAEYYSLSAEAQKAAGILNCGFRVEHQPYEGTDAILRELLCIAPRLGERLVELAGKKLVCGAAFRAAWEQAPNAENRVALGTETDRFGIPRTTLYWRKTNVDRETLKGSIGAFNDWLLDIDGGRIQLADWIMSDGTFPDDSQLAGYHHMGGTRMHRSPKFGVVDGDCKVFGSANLYVAGSSIFTTSGHNNPTLPIVQFALRLADHLAA